MEAGPPDGGGPAHGCLLGLLRQVPGLGRGAVAGVLLQLDAVGGRGTGHVQAQAAVAGYELVITVAQGHCLPLLVCPPAVLPGLDRSAARGGAGAAGHVPYFVLGGGVAVEDIVIATARRLELPFLVGLGGRATGPLLAGSAIGRAPAARVDTRVAVLVDDLVPVTGVDTRRRSGRGGSSGRGRRCLGRGRRCGRSGSTATTAAVEVEL